MKKILVTGANGFIGKNLIEALNREKDVVVYSFTRADSSSLLQAYLHEVDVIYHLAGVNRPTNIDEFEQQNVGLLNEIVNYLMKHGRKTDIIFSSSTQALLDNPYGKSKKKAEDLLLHYSQTTGASVHIYRLTNVFGKWSKPNYNSVVATFCHNISRGMDITIADPSREIELVYIDDVIADFLEKLRNASDDNKPVYADVTKKFNITVKKLAERIYEFDRIRKTLVLPDMQDELTKYLYSTYLSYLDQHDFAYGLEMKTDQRGCLVELIKSNHFGQIFISKSNKGVIRGNHYHHTKVEKFCVIQGKAVVRLRHYFEEHVLEYFVNGQEPTVIDIPPGYTHSIENLTDGEMIVLFWANEIFDPNRPDTYFLEV